MVTLLSVELTNKINGVYIGLFALMMVSFPEFFFGKEGILPYYLPDAMLDPITLKVANYNCRGMGASLLGLAAGCFLEPSSKTVAKMTAIAGLGFLPLFLANILDTSGILLKEMWITTSVFHAGFVILAFLAGFAPENKKKKV